MKPRNEYEIRKLIELAPYRGVWDKIAAEASKAWAIGDYARLRRLGKIALRKGPCGPWKEELRSVLSELEPT